MKGGFKRGNRGEMKIKYLKGEGGELRGEKVKIKVEILGKHVTGGIILRKNRKREHRTLGM